MDASFNEGRHQAGNGAVIVSLEGDVIDVLALPISNVLSPLESELWAIWEGIKVVQHSGRRRLPIITDCLEAEKAVKENEIFRSQGGGLSCS